MSASVAAESRKLSVHPCNFRYAGRLSNENARLLTTIHEKFALHAANALEVYLSSRAQLRFISLEQMVLSEYAASTAAESYLLPCPLGVLESSLLLELDAVLVYPILDLLLGGPGAASEAVRELTEIDEEIMEPIGMLLAGELERAWRSLSLSLKPSRCIRSVGISQVFATNEKLVVLLFEMEVAGATGRVHLVLPTSFVGYLLRHVKSAQAKKTLSFRQSPHLTLRERLLDSTFTVASDQNAIRVVVRDLVELQPGMILRMDAPVKRTGRLTVEDVPIFESTVVRSGKHKAAQLLSRAQEPLVGRE